MPGQNPTLEDLLQSVLDQSLRNTYQALPARVYTYDAKSRTVGVEVLILRSYVAQDGTTKFDKFPPLGGVPVSFMGGEAFGSHVPLKEGDTVVVMWSSASLENWKRGKDGPTGHFVEPFHDAAFHPSDCFAISGYYRPLPAFSKANGHRLGNDDAMTFGAFTPNNDGPVVAITPTEVRLGDKDATNKVARKPDIDAIIGALSDANIAQAIYAYGIAVGGAKPPALAALVTAVNTYFGLHPASCSPNTKVK